MNKKLSGLLSICSLMLLSSTAFAQDTLLEYYPQSGYVLLADQGVASKGVPEDFSTQLKKLHKSKSVVKSMAFTPDGKGWSIITKHGDKTKSVEGNYSKALKTLQSKKLNISSIAFNPINWEAQHGFVIIHDKGYVAEGISSKLKERLDQFANHPDGIKTIEFTPDGGWTVITADHEWSRMIQGKQVKSNFIDNMRAAFLNHKKVESVAFNPEQYSKNYGWILITDKGYEGMNIPESLRQDLLKFSIQRLK